MVNLGHAVVRDVVYQPPEAADAGAEVNDLAGLLRRAGPAEFSAPQRPGFELLVQIRSGQALHEVDFTTYTLRPGDVLWVHGGQVQRWGDITAIDGRVVMFPGTLVDAATSDLLRRLGAWTRNHWADAAPDGSALDAEFAALGAADDRLRQAVRMDPAARSAALAHWISSLLLRIAGDPPTGSAVPTEQDEVYRWFKEEIEKRFTTERSVIGYAHRLGYSTRTLNRAARLHTGSSAKGLIDRRVVLEAKRLLAHETVPVAEVAERLGFEDPANFSKYFTQRAGRTPAEFRRTARSTARP